MPIMAPLADVVDDKADRVWLSTWCGPLQFSIPDLGVLMAGLSIAKIPYEKWVKYILPLMVALPPGAAGHDGRAAVNSLRQF